MQYAPEEGDMFTRSRHFLDCHIAGFTFADGLDVIDELKLGTEVAIVGEPDNPHDPDAVAIYYGDSRIGYIPRNHNADISALLYFGYGNIFETKISSVFPDNPPEQQFRVTVKIKDNRKAGESIGDKSK
jgi:hypothetical protein